jgi:hypothetical protein
VVEDVLPLEVSVGLEEDLLLLVVIHQLLIQVVEDKETLIMLNLVSL